MNMGVTGSYSVIANPSIVITQPFVVIANAVKQSSDGLFSRAGLDCRVAALLAKTVGGTRFFRAIAYPFVVITQPFVVIVNAVKQSSDGLFSRVGLDCRVAALLAKTVGGTRFFRAIAYPFVVIAQSFLVITQPFVVIVNAVKQSSDGLFSRAGLDCRVAELLAKTVGSATYFRAIAYPFVVIAQSLLVIANAVKQSSDGLFSRAGLDYRVAELLAKTVGGTRFFRAIAYPFVVIAQSLLVIANAVKQSSDGLFSRAGLDCRVATLLAMTCFFRRLAALLAMTCFFRRLAALLAMTGFCRRLAKTDLLIWKCCYK
jgi:hypothetical protein